MINRFEVTETNKMIENYNLDVRTITLGISLLDCISDDLETLNNNIYNKITRLASNLVQTGEDISKEYGIPIVNKRISVTPIALIGGSACKKPEDFVTIAKTLDKVAKEVGVNFLGGYSALVNKGMTPAEENLIRSIPEALAVTERVCSSVNVGSSKTGINMDAVRLMGEIVHKTAEKTANQDSLGCAKLVVFCNAPDDNPFMAGAFHGVTEADAITLGSDGVLVATTDGKEQIRGFATEAVDTTGAGDSFWGGFLSQFLSLNKAIDEMDWNDLRACARQGNAVACLCVQKRGGIPAIPKKREVMEFLNQHIKK